MIRILHCIETIASGGVEQTLLTLIRGLDKGKFHHRIICTWKGGPVAEALEKEGIEVTSIGAFKHPFEWRKLQKVIQITKIFKPHIIHGAIFEGMTMATAASIFYKKAKVVFEETSDPQNRSNKANLLLRLMAKKANIFQAISSNVREYLVKNTGINPRKIKVITNGLRFPQRKEKGEIDHTSEYQSFLKNKFVIGFVGRLFDDHKRVSDLINAAKLIESDLIKVLITGDGPDRENLKNLVKELDLLEKVIFVGYQSQPEDFYSLMDILVVPSSREGFGLVAVEAMFYELPVIATKVGGLQEVVVDKETGFLVNPFSPEALAEKIQLLIDQPELRKIMGQKGKARALQYFTAERYCRDVENLYLELLDKK